MHHLYCLFFYHQHYYIPFIFCPNQLYQSQHRSFTFFPILSPSPMGRREGTAVCALLSATDKMFKYSNLFNKSNHLKY